MKRPKTHRRDCFAGSLRAGRLVCRGAQTTIVDAEGKFLRSFWDARSSLRANVGDRLVVSAARLEVDEVAGCEVVEVCTDGHPRVEQRIGAVSDGNVHVMRGQRAAARSE